MKQLLLSTLFATGALAASAQYNVTNGTVTDCDGNPVAGHPVYIVADSIPASGFFFYHTVYTDASGFYTDTIPFPGTPSPLTISTTDPGYPYAWYTENETAASPGNVFTNNFSIACDTVLPPTDTIHTTIFGWVYDCTGSPAGAVGVYYAADSSYGAYSMGLTTSDPLNSFYSIDISYSGAATLPFPVYISTSNAPYAGYTVDTVWISDTTTLGHDLYKECPPYPCAASFWSYYDSTGLSGNDTIYLTLNYASLNPSAATVTWDFGDGFTESGASTVHAYSASGLYNICVTVDNPVDSCTVTYCDTIAFVTRSGSYVVKTSPAAGSALGIKKPEATTYSVYPNPAGDLLHVLSGTPVYSAALFDLSGRQVMSLQNGSASSGLHIDMSGIEKGTYLLTLYNQEKNLVHTHTVLKQ